MHVFGQQLLQIFRYLNIVTVKNLFIDTDFLLLLHVIAQRLNGAIVRVGSDSDIFNNPVFGSVLSTQITANQKIELTCGLRGQYLSVNLPGDEPLTLCEVQAFSGDCFTGSKF